MRTALALACLAALAGCRGREPKQVAVPVPAGHHLRPVTTKTPDDSADRLSLMTLAHGATVVSRTGELYLDNSAVRAIDGDPLSFWSNPPGDLPQSITIALAASTRIDKVGVRTDEALAAKHLQFEISNDGKAFQPLTAVTVAPMLDAQWFDVTPAIAGEVRVTMLDEAFPGRDIAIRSILVHGREVGPPHPGDLAGCWSMNDTAARFTRSGATVEGTIPMGNEPMHLAGGFDGRAERLQWIRGNDYGYALLTVAPGDDRFSGMEWHEEVIPLFYGDSWFGERQPCGAPIPLISDTRERFLRRAGRWSLFDVRFRSDGSIDRDASRDALQWLAKFASAHPVQLVGHEFRDGNADANRAFAQRELDALRIELQRAGVADRVTFVAKGSDDPRQTPDTDSARALYSSVDVEIRR